MDVWRCDVPVLGGLLLPAGAPPYFGQILLGGTVFSPLGCPPL